MLRFSDLSLSFEDNAVFSGLSADLSDGQIVVVTGASGSGKSSLLKSLNGIIPLVEEGSLSGGITLDDINLCKLDICERSRSVSTVFQNPRSQFFCINTSDEIAFGLENRAVEPENILHIIDRESGKLGIENLLDRNIFTLSGGEKQKVAITGVACLDNRLYLFDEPSSSLDRNSIAWLRTTLLDLKAQGKIVVVVEHRLYFLVDILDRLCVIEDGKIHHYTKEELLKDPLSVSDRFRLRSLSELPKPETVPIKVHSCRNTDGDLVCRGLKCCFKKREILNMDIAFNRGITFIIGENGIGKSSFFKCLTGTLRSRGCWSLDGRRLRRAGGDIAAVGQDVNYQLFTDSVLDEVMIGSSDMALVEKTLKRFSLWDKRECHPQVLSGGEKQRVLIARAVVSEKPVVVFDEPTSGLCSGQMESICRCLNEMKDSGKIVIVVTHDYEMINRCGGTVYEFM